MAHQYALVIANDQESVWIDLDTPGWIKTHQNLMRAEGQWTLIERATARPVLSLIVNEGDQPYYTARHLGMIGAGGGAELVAYGIGKKTDHGTYRMWVLPNGAICTGDDLEPLAARLLREGSYRR